MWPDHHSDRSKLSVAFYLRARSIRGRGVFEEIRYYIFCYICIVLVHIGGEESQ